MRIFVGCYTDNIVDDFDAKGEGIYCFDFNTDNGQLTLIDIISTLNPSFLTLSKNGKFLYAIEEIPDYKSAKIKAFKVNRKGNLPSLTLLNVQKLPGSFACHLSLSNSQSHLMVASYMSGNVLVYPVDTNGKLQPLTQNIQHKGSGPNKSRQEAPHPHMIYPYGANNIFVVDLGLDMAKSYMMDDSSGKFIESPDSDIIVEKGAGARHMLIHPSSDYVFIFSELTAEVFSYRIIDEKVEFIESVSSLPLDYNGVPSGAAIRMHPNGRFLYVSNRGSNSITIFRFDEQLEKLVHIGYQSTFGSTPREINMDPTGKWLLVANQDSDNIVVFRIDQSNGLLEKVSVNKDIKTPSSIQFYP